MFRADNRLVLQSLRDHRAGNVRTLLFILMGAAACLLAIACANVANLLLARWSARARELAVRAAIGAGRGRLARQLFTEIALLIAAGTAAAMLFVAAALRGFVHFAAGELPRLSEVATDFRVFGIALLVSLATALLFGGLPALRAGAHRPRNRFCNSAARGAAGGHRLPAARPGRRGSGPLRGPALRRGAAVPDPVAHAERSSRFSARARPHCVHPAARTGSRARRAQGLGVRCLAGSAPHSRHRSRRAHRVHAAFRRQSCPSRSRAPTGRCRSRFIAATASASAAWVRTTLKAAGSRMVQGRFFTDDDFHHPDTVAVINEAAARAYFPGESAARQADSGRPRRSRWKTVVGVIADSQEPGPEPSRRPEAFINDPVLAGAGDLLFLVRTLAPEGAVARVLRRCAPIPGLFTKVETLDEAIGQLTASPRFNTVLLSTFAGIAFLMAMVGVYGVLAFSVAQRRAEIGIRMALGATPGAVLALVMREGALAGSGRRCWPVSPGRLFLTRSLATLLYGVKATDPGTYAAVVAVLALAALSASFLPARHAAIVDPAVTLRHE